MLPRGARRTAPASSPTARWRPDCSALPSPPSGPRRRTRVTVGARAPTSPEIVCARNLDLVEALSPTAERHAVSVRAVAIAWTLSFPGVTGAIVGARRPAQVDGWLPANTLTLNAGELDDITSALVIAGSGPLRSVA
jgi:aryl-alcohol dehydrogenase-like predicted oxidoreductase